MHKKIILTGGGTAGHVTPNLALIEKLKRDGWQIDYVGSKTGIEKNMIEAVHIPFHSVSTGKLRRYFSWQNFIDPCKIMLGIIQAWYLLSRLKPDVVFSKGGFVAFPVVVGAWLRGIPVVVHESDMTPGLANKMSFPFANKICLTFAPAQKHFKKTQKTMVTGTPIRDALLTGSQEQGLAICGFNAQKPCLLVIGGSQGASALNVCIRQALEKLSRRFQVIHLCGRGKIDQALQGKEGYYQLEYATDELADLFAVADVVVSRSGANALCEMLALEKPHVLIPLPLAVSRGDQVQNARYFQEAGISLVINEAQLTPDLLLDTVEQALTNRDEIIAKIKKRHIHSATEQITSLLEDIANVESKGIV